MDTPNTPNWQISINDPNVILADRDDIAQSVFIILSTMKGSDPLRPTFGSDIYTFLDMPINTATPMIVYEVYDAIERWENRISIKSVTVSAWDFNKKTIVIKGIITVPTAQVTININL